MHPQSTYALGDSSFGKVMLPNWQNYPSSDTCEAAGATPAVEKGLTSAGLRFYASKDCHLLLQVTDDCDVDAIMNSGNAERKAMSPGGHFNG